MLTDPESGPASIARSRVEGRHPIDAWVIDHGESERVAVQRPAVDALGRDIAPQTGRGLPDGEPVRRLAAKTNAVSPSSSPVVRRTVSRRSPAPGPAAAVRRSAQSPRTSSGTSSTKVTLGRGAVRPSSASQPAGVPQLGARVRWRGPRPTSTRTNRCHRPGGRRSVRRPVRTPRRSPRRRTRTRRDHRRHQRTCRARHRAIDGKVLETHRSRAGVDRLEEEPQSAVDRDREVGDARLGSSST